MAHWKHGMAGLVVAGVMACVAAAQALPPPRDPAEEARALAERTAVLRAAANAGDAKAQWELGQLLEGAGQAESLAWFRKAAAQGHDAALMHLADRLMAAADGRGAQEALDWLRRAALRGQVQAQVRLGDALGFGFPGVAVNEAEAQRWYREAAGQGDPWAQQRLAQALRDGRGAAKDEAEAVRWFEKAARQGDALSQFYLAEMLQQGRGTARDEAAAVGWYAQAVQGHGGPQIAAYALGRCYEMGQGVAQDFAQAARWYEVGARANEGRSQRKLSRLLRAGRGVPADPVRAYAWLTLAMQGEMGHTFDPEEREELAAVLTPAQRAEGQRLATQWRPGEAMARSALAEAGSP